MMRWVILLVAVLTIAVACGGRKAGTPQPQTAPSGVTGARPGPPVETPPPTPAPPPPMLPAYPGALETGTLTFKGKGPTGAQGQWSMTTLETTDPFERVWNFYSEAPPRGFSQSFSSVQNPGEGRKFLRWFVRADRRAWLTVEIQDEKMEGKVTITLSAGSAP